MERIAVEYEEVEGYREPSPEYHVRGMIYGSPNEL